LTALRGNNNHLFEEMKSEIADLRHSLHGTEVELKLLEEKFESAENTSPKNDVSSLKHKIALLEKTVDKMSTDLKSLMSYANQTTTSLSHYRDQIQEIDRKLSEVGKLRSTLSQMSKTYSAENTYRVEAGDSLDKIARKFQTTADALKKQNRLTSDRIVIGQELTLPQ
jgi:LysM repeat protein